MRPLTSPNGIFASIVRAARSTARVEKVHVKAMLTASKPEPAAVTIWRTDFSSHRVAAKESQTRPPHGFRLRDSRCQGSELRISQIGHPYQLFVVCHSRRARSSSSIFFLNLG